MAHDVFISYSTKDKSIADAACHALEERGIRCWIAPRDVTVGADWTEQIIDALDTSQALVLIFSSNSNDSKQVRREIGNASERDIPIFPLRIENVPMSKQFRFLLSGIHWLDALTPPLEAHLKTLADKIFAMLAVDEESGPGDRVTPSTTTTVTREHKNAGIQTTVRDGYADAPYFGIDFGTTYSSMAWYDANKAEAKIILNDHDEAKTPSLVFFGKDDEILVGNDAANKIEEYENSDDPQEREYVSQWLVRSIKRYLINPPVIPIPGNGDVRPVEVVALILGKLKQDAEQNHFYEQVERVVLTCPAVFSAQERNVLREAAEMVGFKEVELFEEPTATALAVHEQGLRIGKGILIYDLGASTFDLSVVTRGEDGSFYVSMEPQGDPRLGGDVFDLELYRHCDRVAQEELGRSISLAGDIDLLFLKECRAHKENLSRVSKSRFSHLLSSNNSLTRFAYEIDRNTFEGLIQDQVEGTVKQTARLLEQAESRGHEVDTVVLIGGSSQVPLVGRMLAEALPVKPRNFAGIHAVALGAAYYANVLWSRNRIGLSSSATAGTEREVMGDTKRLV